MTMMCKPTTMIVRVTAAWYLQQQHAHREVILRDCIAKVNLLNLACEPVLTNGDARMPAYHHTFLPLSENDDALFHSASRYRASEAVNVGNRISHSLLSELLPIERSHQ
jgi:hypothetical protein